MKTLRFAAAALMLLTPSAFGGVIVYNAILTGPNESPPNASPGTGFGEVDIDTVLQTMHVLMTFSGLTTGDTAAHIHCCTPAPFTGTAGVATTTPTFTGFPGGVTSGTYDHIFDLTLATSYNPAFVTAEGSLANAEAALLAGLNEGTTYLNIHTTNFPNGEIRGFLTVAPEPGCFLLAGSVLAGLVIRRRRSRA